MGGGGGSNDSQTTAEAAMEFWDKDESGAAGKEQQNQKDGQQVDQGAGNRAAQDAQQQGENKDGKDGQNQSQIADEVLQADPRYKEVAAFRDEVQPILDQHGIPDSKELGLQLADSAVLYQIAAGQAKPSQLLDVMAQNAAWSKDQVGAVAQDLIGWLTKQGFLKEGQVQNAGGENQNGNRQFNDPALERLDKLEREREEERRRGETEKTQKAEQERQSKIFNSYTTKVTDLLKAKGLVDDKGNVDPADVDMYGRAIRALIDPKTFNAVIGRIEKGNFVDVIKLFDQVHSKETARLKAWTDRQTKSATRRDGTAPRVPAGGAPPAPAGKQQRNLRDRDERLAAANAEWDK
jgi:hypothetical protein